MRVKGHITTPIGANPRVRLSISLSGPDAAHEAQSAEFPFRADGPPHNDLRMWQHGREVAGPPGQGDIEIVWGSQAAHCVDGEGALHVPGGADGDGWREDGGCGGDGVD